MNDEKISLPAIEEIETAQKPNNWTLANSVLYSLCKENPSQSDVEAIVSKFWLIGRAYSASVERRRTKHESALDVGEDFYTHRLAKNYRLANLDEKFDALYQNDYSTITKQNYAQIVGLHSLLTNVLFEITGQRKISLASKYLHFHFPDLFFIYDSRASISLEKYVPKWTKRKLEKTDSQDDTYSKFCLACIELREAIQLNCEIVLNPRQLDNLLLNTYK